MIVPAAEFIEIAVDQVKQLPKAQLAGQLEELGDALGQGTSPDLRLGYQIGLQTARVVLQGLQPAMDAKFSL